jgi:hypothetical protein
MNDVWQGVTDGHYYSFTIKQIQSANQLSNFLLLIHLWATVLVDKYLYISYLI